MNIKYKIKLVILCMGVFFVANTARAQVFEKLQKYIDALNNIKPFATTTTTTRTIPSTRVIISNEIDNDYSDASDSVRGFCFKKTLKLGDTNNDVKELQNFLALDKKIYPEGIVSGYFGKLTEKAVKQFQIKYYREIMEPANIISPTGLVGAFTLKQLNIVAGCNKNTNDIKINTD